MFQFCRFLIPAGTFGDILVPEDRLKAAVAEAALDAVARRFPTAAVRPASLTWLSDRASSLPIPMLGSVSTSRAMPNVSVKS